MPFVRLSNAAKFHKELGSLIKHHWAEEPRTYTCTPMAISGLVLGMYGCYMIVKSGQDTRYKLRFAEYRTPESGSS